MVSSYHEKMPTILKSEPDSSVQRGEHVEHEFKPSKEETEQEISNQNQNDLKTNESKCESLSTRSVVTRSKKNNDIQKQSSHTNPSTDIPIDSNFKNLQLHQRRDPDLEQVYTWLLKKERPSYTEVIKLNPAVRHYWHSWGSLVLKDGVIHRKFYKKDATGDYLQILVPNHLKHDIMKQVHDGVFGGHLGRKKTKAKLLQKYNWYQCREDIYLWIKRCDNCAINKKPTKNPKAYLGELRVGAPLGRLGVDILGPLPLTPRNNRYILIATDYFTKWVELMPVPDQTAVTCADAILKQVVCQFGCPLSIHTDQGRNFESDIFKELCRLLEVKKTRTTARNPKCNGQVERFNRILLRMIKAYLKG